MVEANIMTVRQKTTKEKLFDSEIANADEAPCGGIMIMNNIFKDNGGCKYTYGALQVYCFAEDLKDSLEGTEFERKILYSSALDS